jgi:pimeloyl-ACP methyl ester carboxylesterase
MPADMPLVLLPGMGTDERYYRPQMVAFPNLVVPKWLPPKPGEGLARYARRTARAADPGVPCVVGGASFGGMVAVEAADHFADARACVLIGSVRSPGELPPYLRILRPVAELVELVPFELIRPITRLTARLMGRWLPRSVTGFLKVAGDADAALLRWACSAALTWNASGGPKRCPVLHIHGAVDRTLPAAYTHADEIVPGAGHVLTLTHPREVNAFLARVLRRFS